jgi:hypothetical protein
VIGAWALRNQAPDYPISCRPNRCPSRVKGVVIACQKENKKEVQILRKTWLELFPKKRDTTQRRCRRQIDGMVNIYAISSLGRISLISSRTDCLFIYILMPAHHLTLSSWNTFPSRPSQRVFSQYSMHVSLEATGQNAELHCCG